MQASTKASSTTALLVLVGFVAVSAGLIFAATRGSKAPDIPGLLWPDPPVLANFSLLGHFGYSDGNGIETAYGQDNYFDWAAGVGYTWDHFDFSLKYVDGEDLETLRDTPRDISNSEAVVIFTVSTSVPWKKDGE